MAYRVREVDLGGGDTVLARVENLESDDLAAAPGGYGHGEDVGALDGLADRAANLQRIIGSVGRGVLDAARQAGPDEVGVTFGVELAVKSGKTVAFIADGEAKASLSVTLTWHRADADGAAPGPAAAESATSPTSGGRTGAGPPPAPPVPDARSAPDGSTGTGGSGGPGGAGAGPAAHD